MRVRARVAGLAGALTAMVASLTGCITVHGETAVVPATTKQEAQEALDRWVEVYNDAYSSFDPALSERVERGPMGAIDNAVLRAQQTVNPDGNPDYQPLELSDTTLHIPQQAGWPKFFLADSAAEGSDSHLLQVFSRNSIDEKWYATYLAVLPANDVPEFAEDEDGFLADIPIGDSVEASGEDAGEGLAMAPGELSGNYARYLQEDAEVAALFADGQFTSDVLANRAEENSTPEYEMHYQDDAADEPENAPVAVRTEDGGALVIFATHHFDRQAVAQGYTPTVDPLVEALMEGEAVTQVTREWMGMQAALVPEGDGQIDILSRRAGVISAQGE
ncbi:hypothetical protein [Streptomyces sp. B6B3]|uniref:hypothetical protein n=1 Tax=Streptomyces sp. B6B3 TaxID=3153570 RepID=UPI00325C8A53